MTVNPEPLVSGRDPSRQCRRRGRRQQGTATRRILSGSATSNGGRLFNTYFALVLVLSAVMQVFALEPRIYGLFQAALYLLTVVLVMHALTLETFSINSRTILMMGAVILVTQAAKALLGIISGHGFDGRDILLLPLLMVILGFNFQGDAGYLRKLAYLYGASAAFAGWYVVSVHGADIGYVGQYFFAAKNQLGTVLGAATALLLYTAVQLLDSRLASPWLIVTCFVLAVLNVVPLLDLRSRGAIVAVGSLSAILLFKGLLGVGVASSSRIVVIGLLVVAAIFSGRLTEVFSKVLFANTDAGDLNSVSSNRIEGYDAALGFIQDNPLFGEYFNDFGFQTPHNFVLNLLVDGGLLLSIGYLAVYSVFAVLLWKAWFGLPLRQVPAWAYLLLVAFIMSLFEYAHPFGPGTTQIAAWFLVGYGLREKRRLKVAPAKLV